MVRLCSLSLKLTSDTVQAKLTSLLLAFWCLASSTLADPKAKAKAKAQLDYYGEYGEYNYADYGDYGPGQYTVNCRAANEPLTKFSQSRRRRLLLIETASVLHIKTLC